MKAANNLEGVINHSDGLVFKMTLFLLVSGIIVLFYSVPIGLAVVGASLWVALMYNIILLYRALIVLNDLDKKIANVSKDAARLSIAYVTGQSAEDITIKDKP